MLWEKNYQQVWVVYTNINESITEKHNMLNFTFLFNSNGSCNTNITE
jgi:hypothetical protein